MKNKRFWTMLLSVILTCAVSLSAIAGEHTVGTSDEFTDAFNGDTDDTVTITMTADIELAEALVGQEGKTYTINGENYVLSEVEILGSGEIEINADIDKGSGYTGLVVGEEVVLTVNGDVNDGAYVYENAQVTINGDINGVDGEPGVDVDMDDPDSWDDGDVGLYVSGDANVTVNGDVTGGDAYGNYGYGKDAIVVDNNANVTVNGDVTGGSVTANPEVEKEDNFSRGGAGINVYSPSASVTVNGDVTGGDTNGDKGQAGDAIVVAVFEKDSYLDEGEEPGQIIVDGTVVGGTAENGQDGSAILLNSMLNTSLFESELLDWLEEDLSGKTSDELQADMQVITQYYIPEILGRELVTEESFYTDYIVSLYEEVIDELGINVTPPAYDASTEEWNAFYAALGEAMAAMSPEEAEAYEEKVMVKEVQLIQDMVKDSISTLVAESDTNEIKVWELSDENGGALIGTYDYLNSYSGKVDLPEEVAEENVSYLIHVEQPKNGSITVDKTEAKEGEIVKVTVKANEGYEVASVSNGLGKLTAAEDGSYSFEMPLGGGITISANLVEITNNTNTGNPDTGDHSDMGAWGTFAVVSVACLGALIVLRKKMVA